MIKTPEISVDPEGLAALVETTLAEYKGVDVLRMDLRAFNAFTDMMILCTGTSSRHLANLAKQLIKVAKERKLDILSIEGLEQANWVALDLNSVVVHLMLAEVREYYAIERIWSD